MCVPILRSVGTKLTNLENMQKLYVFFDVTDAKMVCRTSWRLDSYFHQEHFATNQKSLRLPVQNYGSKQWF